MTAAASPGAPVGEALEYGLTGYGGQRTTATVHVVHRSRSERTGSAVRGLAAAWGAAVASAFVPVAHFVLVPALLAFGVYRFVTRMSADVVAVGANGACPDCGRAQELDVAGRWRVPRYATCRHCQRSLRIDARPVASLGAGGGPIDGSS